MMLQILLSGIDISLLTSFNVLLGREHGPQDLVSSSELIKLFISSGFVGEVKEYGILGGRYTLDPSGG